MGKTTYAALAGAAAWLAAAPVAAEPAEAVHPDPNLWPMEVNQRPLTLAPGMVEVRGDTFRTNLSDDAVAEPVSFAPDLYVGIDENFTAGLKHRVGLCFTPGEESNCPTPYHDAELEATYGFMHGGTMQLALRGSFAMPRFDPFVGGFRGGALARLRVGGAALVAEPSVYTGVIGRSEESATHASPVRETLDLPVTIQYQAHDQTAIFATAGFHETFRDFGDQYEIPVGLGAVFAVNHRIDVGGEFVFKDAFGVDGGIDRRILYLRAALRV